MARMARGQDLGVFYSKQTAQGAINASPVMIPLVRSSGQVKELKSFVQDDTVLTTFDGQTNIADTVAIEASFECSVTKQAITNLIAAINGVEVAYTNTAATFAATATGFTVPAPTYAAVNIGDAFWVTGFANTAISQMYIIANKTGGTTLVTSIAPPATEAAGASVTFKSNRTKNADTQSFYTIQNRWVDASAGGTSYYTTFDHVVDTARITLAPNGIMKSAIAFKGEQKVSGTALISGQTDSAYPADSVVSCTANNVIGLYVDGLSVVSKMRSMGVNISNGLLSSQAAGALNRYARGTFSVSGDLVIRSEVDNTLNWQAIYRSETRKAIAFLIKHSATEQTLISLPKVCITAHNQDDKMGVIADHTMSYAAEGDTVTLSTVNIYKNW